MAWGKLQWTQVGRGGKQVAEQKGKAGNINFAVAQEVKAAAAQKQDQGFTRQPA